jgi:periplasmic divalent cation tolerance protein
MGAASSSRTGGADQPNDPTRDQSPQPVCVVLSSESTPERAEALARALLEQRLVACVSLLPVRSLYRWQGKLETANEVKMLLKTSPEQLEPLHQTLHALHSYQTPEWILLSGSTWGDYGAWLAAQLA